MNRKTFLIVGVVGLGFIAGGLMPVRADAPDRGESKVTMAQLPAAVARTLTREAQGGQVGEIDMNIGNHQATYEADVVIAKQPYEIKIAMDGTLLRKHLSDADLSMAKLPPEVQATIKQEMGGGRASDIGEHFFENGDSYYKATVKIGEHTYKLKVLPNGTLLKMKLKEQDGADHQDGDHGDHGGHGGHGNHADHGHGGDQNSQRGNN